MPSVNEAPYDLETFRQYITEFNRGLGENGVKDFESKLSNFQTIIEQTLKHQYIDTLARKYWLKQKSYIEQNKDIDYDWNQLIKNIVASWLS